MFSFSASMLSFVGQHFYTHGTIFNQSYNAHIE